MNQGLAHTDRNGLLTYTEMNGTSHFLFSIITHQLLFNNPDTQHFFI
jgi:hypothetical protein